MHLWCQVHILLSILQTDYYGDVDVRHFIQVRSISSFAKPVSEGRAFYPSYVCMLPCSGLRGSFLYVQL